MKGAALKSFWDFHDFFLLGMGLAAAALILTFQDFGLFLHSLGTLEYLGVFIAGMFFSSGLTATPAASVLFVSAENLNPFLVAFVGACGALMSDYLLFRFFRDSFLMEIRHFSERFHFHPHLNRTIHAIVNRFSSVIGGLILASPLPDELAASFCGSIKMYTKKFLLVAFVFKFLGILAIALLSNVV